MGNKLLATLIIILSIFWSFNVIISSIAGYTENRLFQNKLGDVSDSYMTQITPKAYTFMIWNLIFLWVLTGYIFLIICILISSNSGYGRVYCSPEVFTTPVAVILIVNCACYTSWLFVWDNEYIIAASAILFCIMGSNWLALTLFSLNLYENTMILQRSPIVLNCYRILVQNSLGVYTTWTTISALLNLAIVLVYEADVKDPTPSLISLGILTGLLAIWVPLDAFVVDKYCRYMITPLFVVLWALFGILFRLENDEEFEDNTPKYFTVGLIGVVVVLLIGRVVLTIFRAVRFPLK